MTNYAHGHDAEKVAVKYLKKLGYKILARNWRVPRAEIDIVAQKKHGPVVLIEVKYRESDAQGTGLDYITPRKLEQMQFSAELWVAENKCEGDYTLGAVEVSGTGYIVTSFLDDII